MVILTAQLFGVECWILAEQLGHIQQPALVTPQC
jgi:hypothetical protein